MRTLFYLLSCAVLFGAALWSYSVSYGTRDAAKRVALLEAEIDAETSRIDVLQAEWAYLNRPERLIALAEANFETLGLDVITPDHYADASLVPTEEKRIETLIINAVTAASGSE